MRNTQGRQDWVGLFGTGALWGHQTAPLAASLDVLVYCCLFCGGLAFTTSLQWFVALILSTAVTSHCSDLRQFLNATKFLQHNAPNTIEKDVLTTDSSIYWTAPVASRSSHQFSFTRYTTKMAALLSTASLLVDTSATTAALRTASYLSDMQLVTEAPDSDSGHQNKAQGEILNSAASAPSNILSGLSASLSLPLASASSKTSSGSSIQTGNTKLSLLMSSFLVVSLLVGTL